MPNSDVRYLTIHSTDRDTGAWPTAAEYEVEFDNICNMTELCVRALRMPAVFPVAQGHDTLTVTVGGVAKVVTVLAPGYARGDALTYLKSLQEALVAELPAGEWSVTLGEDGRVRFDSAVAFQLLGRDAATSPADGYGARGAGRALGLPAAISSSAAVNSFGRYELVAPHRNQMDEPETLYLHVDGVSNLGAIETTVASAGMGADGCLEIVDCLRGDVAGNISGTVMQNVRPTRHFLPPVARVRRLHVRVMDYYGGLAAFDNREHRIELLVCTTDSSTNCRGGYNPQTPWG